LNVKQEAIIKSIENKECIHYSSCPLKLETSAYDKCHKVCGGHNCIHFSDCCPPPIIVKETTISVESGKTNQNYCNRCKNAINNKTGECTTCNKLKASQKEAQNKCKICSHILRKDNGCTHCEKHQDNEFKPVKKEKEARIKISAPSTKLDLNKTCRTCSSPPSLSKDGKFLMKYCTICASKIPMCRGEKCKLKVTWNTAQNKFYDLCMGCNPSNKSKEIRKVPKCSKCENDAFFDLRSNSYKSLCMQCYKGKDYIEKLNTSNIPGSAKPTYKSVLVQEAIVTKNPNPQGVTKQAPDIHVSYNKRPVVPMYIYTDKGYELNGMITMVKRNGHKLLITCKHQLYDNKVCYVTLNDKYVELAFTHFYEPDFAAMLCPSWFNISECAALEMVYPNVNERDYYLYTRKIPSLEPTSVWCSSVTFDNYEDPKYLLHKSDTFNGQCGSPYVTNNKVVAIHNMSDYVHNKGLIIPVQLFSDF